MAKTPLHIIRKSRNWHQNTVTGTYIHEANLDAHNARKRLAAERDKEIQKKRWDLNYD